MYPRSPSTKRYNVVMTQVLDVSNVSARLLEAYAQDKHTHAAGCEYVPSREEVTGLATSVLAILFPGFFGQRPPSTTSLADLTTERVSELAERLGRQVECCFRYSVENRAEVAARAASADASRDAVARFVGELPSLRERLLLDVRAAVDSDPAASSTEEVLLAYPGVFAVAVYRIAHALRGLGVPLMPRMMTEWAHEKTGIDIHPGATIGPALFIDHGTGVVIGETATVGARVRLYQGVTLGALSLPRDAFGRVSGGKKRHPTLEDDVTVYANATILGGNTVIGRGAIIGGSTFVTKSVPAYHRVVQESPRLIVLGQQELEFNI